MKTYKFQKERQGKDLNFEIVDTMGIESDGGMCDADIDSLLDGHIPDKYNVSITVFLYCTISPTYELSAYYIIMLLL